MSDPVLEIPFVGGIDEGTREEIVDPRSWTTLENVRQNERGGAEKRLGYADMVLTNLDGTSRSAGRSLFMNGTQLCCTDGTYLYVWAPSPGRWVNKGRVPEAHYQLREIPTIGDEAVCVDTCAKNGVLVLLYYVPVFHVDSATATSYMYAVTVDATTGAVLIPPEFLESEGSAITVIPDIVGGRLASYGNIIMAFSPEGVSNDIYVHYLDTSSAATLSAGWVSLGVMFTDFVRGFAAVSLAADTSVAIAYGLNSSGGANRLHVKRVTIAGVVESVAIATTSLTPNTIALSELGTTLWAAWDEEVSTDVHDVKVIGLDPADIDGTPLASTLTVIDDLANDSSIAGLLNVYVTNRGAGKAALHCNYNPGADSFTLAVVEAGIQTSGGAAALDGTPYTFYGARVQGAPFLRGDRIYAPIAGTNLRELTLCDVTPPRTGTHEYLRPVVHPVQRSVVVAPVAGAGCRSTVLSSTTYGYGIMVRKSGSTTGLTLGVWDFAHVPQTATLNGSTVLSGGVVSVFDGSSVFEENFLSIPGFPFVLSTAAAGLVTLTTGRRYVVLWEHVDADGNWHTSGTSEPSDLTGAVTNKLIELVFPPLSVTSRGSQEDDTASSLRAAIYATEDGGSEPYHRIGTVQNNPNVDNLHFFDNVDDSVVAIGALLYGTGNLPGTGASQDHRAPPGLRPIVSYNGMLVGASGSQVFFSAQPIDGEGTWFSPVFARSIDEDVVALAVQDGAVIPFTGSGAYALAGEPPADNGTGGLGTPRKLAVDQGCISPHVLTTNAGTFFQSARGIELFNRGQTVQFIGDKVQTSVAAYPYLSSAVLDTKEGLARFSLAESATAGVVSTNGRDLIFDMSLGLWISRDTKRGSVADQASQDACMAYIDGAWRYTWIASGGTVYYERDEDDASAHLDGSTWITMRAIGPWLHIAGLQGEQFIDQVLLLAKRLTGHDLTISLAFDYVDSYTSAKTFSAATIASQAREWLVKEVGQTTSQAVRIKVEDATPSSGSVGTGQGGTWIGLTLSGKPHQGVKRNSAIQRGGSAA